MQPTAVPSNEATRAKPQADRDRALDMARGYAIVAMITSHVGGPTVLNMAANFPYLLSAADGFVLVSGVAAGMVAERKLALGPVGSFYRDILRRAGRLYVIHCLLTLVVIFIHHYTGRLRSPDIEELGGVPSTLWLIATLQVQPLDYMNILPLFIVFFLAVPLLFEALRRGRGWLALGASLVLWLVAQRYPDLIPLPRPVGEARAFSLAAWQFPFVVGVALGYHRRRVLALFARTPTWGRALLLLGVGLELVWAQCQRVKLERFHLKLALPDEWLLSKPGFGPLHAVYAITIIAFGYALFDWLSQHRPRALARPIDASLSALEMIGRKSLYCFVMHLPFALLASAVGSSSWSGGAQNLFTATAILYVYLLSRWDGLARALRL